MLDYDQRYSCPLTILMDNLKSKTISSLFWKLMERGGNAVVSLVVQIILARLLAPEDFGMLAIIIVFVNIGAVFVQSGLNSALVQSPNVSKEDYSTVFWCCLFVAVILYCGLFLCAPYIGDFYDNHELVGPLRVISFLLIINALNSIQVAKVTRDLELRKIFYATLFSVVISGIFGVAIAFFGFGIWALVAQQLIYQMVSCLVLGAQIDWRPSCVFSLKRAKELFGFGWKILVSGLLNTFYQSLSSLIIGKQFSQYSLGLVSQGEKYPQAIGNMLDGAIQPVMFSAVSRVQQNINSVKGLTKRALKTSSFLIIPIMSTFALVAEPFIEVFLGEQWLEAVPFFQIYCFVYALYPIQTSNLQAINGIGRSDIFLKLEVIKKIYGVGIILFAAFVLNDLYAVVIGLLISNILSIFVNSVPTKRLVNYGILEQIKDILPSVLITAMACTIGSMIGLCQLTPIATLFLEVFVIGISYVALSAVFKVEEFNYLVATIKEKYFKVN